MVHDDLLVAFHFFLHIWPWGWPGGQLVSSLSWDGWPFWPPGLVTTRPWIPIWDDRTEGQPPNHWNPLAEGMQWHGHRVSERASIKYGNVKLSRPDLVSCRSVRSYSCSVNSILIFLLSQLGRQSPWSWILFVWGSTCFDMVFEKGVRSIVYFITKWVQIALVQSIFHIFWYGTWGLNILETTGCSGGSQQPQVRLDTTRGPSRYFPVNWLFVFPFHNHLCPNVWSL